MNYMKRIPARSLSFAIGLLSLGAETLWVRTYSFQSQSTPKAVAVVLGAYLLGIAVGAAIGARLCRSHEKRLPEILGAALLGGSAVILVSPFVLSTLATMGAGIALTRGSSIGLAFLPALIFSICFPICHHLGTALEPGRVGNSMSRVYAANIAGSAIGPLLMNFGLLELATTQLAFAVLGLMGVCVGIGLLISSNVRASNSALEAGMYASIALAAISVLASTGSNNWLITSLAAWQWKLEVRHVVETRQGIVVSFRDDQQGDLITGGNVYDGRANVDPRRNSNGIDRILVLAALRPKPKRILVVGQSIGSWVYLITGFQGVEQIDVVEINPGYLELISDYEKQSAALNDPRLHLHIGDGRKFIRAAPPESYDIVVMNTTYHWRAYASLLLSKEFLTLVRSRMTAGGLLAFNTTGSPDTLNTASSVFPFAYLYDNFAVCADFDWRRKLDDPASVAELLSIKPQGDQLLREPDRSLVETFLSQSHTQTTDEVAAKANRPLEIITDRNLITEYRYGLAW